MLLIVLVSCGQVVGVGDMRPLRSSRCLLFVRSFGKFRSFIRRKSATDAKLGATARLSVRKRYGFIGTFTSRCGVFSSPFF